MKTLLQQYTAQHGESIRTLDSIIDDAWVQLDDLDTQSKEYQSIMTQLTEVDAYKQSISDYIKEVMQLADASKEASPSDWNNPEQTAIGYALDNSGAGDSTESDVEFISTLDMYIDCGIECEKDLDEGCQQHAVNLPTFKG